MTKLHFAAMKSWKYLWMATMFSFSCGASSFSAPKKDRGYCFQAEGLSKKKCYSTINKCLNRQSSISDHHPWAKITYSCQRSVF